MRLAHLVSAITVVMAAAAPATAGSGAKSVAQLAWLSGDWVSERDGRWAEEQWSTPRGGLMLGTGRSGKGERATGFEFMRIALDRGGKVVFWGSPGGSAPVPFHLVEAGARSVAFANPNHDFPKRISYRRNGDTLTAVVSGDTSANTQAWTYRRRSAGAGSAK